MTFERLRGFRVSVARVVPVLHADQDDVAFNGPGR